MNDSKYIELIRYIAASAIFSILIFFYAASVNPDVGTEKIAEASVSDNAVITHNITSPETHAAACALIDANSGKILYSENQNEKLPMASTTKIMTALIVLENCDMNETVVIPKEASGVEGSSIYLLPGEELTVKELLYGLMLESGNDAACALAIHTSGSIENFAALMNEKAKAMCLTSTHFDNPHGLSSQSHYTTALELARITALALKNDDFRQIVSTEKYVIAEREKCAARYFSNHNKLLKNLDICTGVKTGYTLSSGRCLVTSSQTENGLFVAVTLNDRNDWNDHKNMLLFANDNFESIKIAEKGELAYCFSSISYPQKMLFVSNTDDIYITRQKSENDIFSMTCEIARSPCDIGDVAGYVTVNCDNICESFPLYAVEEPT